MPQPIGMDQIKLTGGYLYEKESLVRDTTLPALYESYQKTGRVNALKHNWRTNEPNQPHLFWDSDIAKWIEGAAYTLMTLPNPELEKTIDALIADIEKTQTPDGYFNTHFQTVEYANRFTRRPDHELYCAGHLMEAAAAYFYATGKRALLDIVCRYADYIERIFMKEKRPPHFITPGHEEIELALVKLYEATGEERYLRLAKFFIDQRGITEEEKQTFTPWYGKEYAQDHLPVREQKTAEGHAVRALYLYAGMADIARLCRDDGLKAACEALFGNIVEKRMHVTGGLGGNYHGESFSYDYDLPNELTYNETCASIAFMFFARRMFTMTGEAKYIHPMELMVYNAVPAGLSASGDRFFYTNPLEMHPERRDYHLQRGRGQYTPEYERPEDFNCSCCPPNVIRFFTSLKSYMYHTKPECIYINLYGASVYESGGIRIEQKTNYPWEPAVEINLHNLPAQMRLYLRIPDWCDSYQITVNGGETPSENQNGYAVLKQHWRDGDNIRLTFDMPVMEIHAHPLVHYNAGRIAVRRGPVVYCAESADNGHYIKSAFIKKDAGYRVSNHEKFNIPAIECSASVLAPDDGALYRKAPPVYKDKSLRLIPYALWANRGAGEMNVWLLKEK
jgi:hypothetical protein